jgi:hypothetical protein
VATGTTGVSVGTAAPVAKRSNKLCRRRRYSSSLGFMIIRQSTILVKNQRHPLEETVRVGSCQIVQSLSQRYAIECKSENVDDEPEHQRTRPHLCSGDGQMLYCRYDVRHAPG